MYVCVYIHKWVARSNASYLFPSKLQQIKRAQKNYLIKQILSYKTLFFNVVITISQYKQMNWWRCSSFCGMTALHGCLNTAYLSCCYCHCWNTSATISLCSHPLFGLQKCSASIDKCQWVHFFWHGGIQFHTFASYVLPSQTPLCHTALFLPSVSWQQNVMEYQWEGSTSTAIPPTSIPNVLGQHNKIGGITFGAILIYISSISPKGIALYRKNIACD